MRARWTGVLVAAMVAAGCSSDGGSGPSPSDVSGAWQLTKMQFVSQANPQLSVDLIAQGGTATMTIDADKTFVIILNAPSTPTETIAGTWSLSGSVLTMVRTGKSGDLQFQVTLTAQTIKLAGASVEFDVNDDGTDEPATLNIEGTR
jgi:hypothetical protein